MTNNNYIFKRIFIITGIILNGIISGLFSQTPEEKSLFDRINEHRISLGIGKLVWDSNAYNMATHHAKYISIINSLPYDKKLLSHDEKFNIHDFEEMSFNERCKKFITQKHALIRENCAIHNIVSHFKSNKPTKPIDEILYEQWLTSKEGHKENMEAKESKKGACSIIHYMTPILLEGKILQFECVIAVLDID